MSDVDAWVAALPEERRPQVAELVALLRGWMPEGYEETLAHGMPTWQVPLSAHAATTNGQALSYVSLAARATGCALYLTGVYADPDLEQRLRTGFAAAGKKVDLGKSCLRFKRLDDLDLDVLGEVVGRYPAAELVGVHPQAR